MKLAIICAMEEELAEIIAVIPLQFVSQITKAQITYLEYKLGEHEIIAVISGIGKVNAAITTQILISEFASVDAVLNVGVAGSLSPELNFGDVIIANDLVQHDFDIRPFGVPLGQIARMDTFSFLADEKLNELLQTVTLVDGKVVIGRVVSGDQFIDDKSRAIFLHEHFDALACEMEGASIAHVCYLNQIPFAIVRSLSDMAGQEGVGVRSFNELKSMAANRAALVVKNLLERL